MATTPEQEHRVARLRDLLEHADFGGIKAKLGRALGYENGAFVRQMLDGERPVSEKTVLRVETMQNGKYKGWFASTADTALTPRVLRAARLMQQLPERQQFIAYALIQTLHNPDGADQDQIRDDLDPLLAAPTPQQDKAQ